MIDDIMTKDMGIYGYLSKNNLLAGRFDNFIKVAKSLQAMGNYGYSEKIIFTYSSTKIDC